MSQEKMIKVFVKLLEEGTDTIRPTQAIDLGNGLAKLLPTEGYDPEDEIWEFLPGTVVKIKEFNLKEGDVIIGAYEKAG